MDRSRPDTDMDTGGILVVDKPLGVTSHDVVAYVRRRFRIKKVGHAGTLDPGATGVLVLLLGKATKLSGTFLNQDKEYEAVLRLGTRTDSGDLDGKVISMGEVSATADEITSVIKSFQGEIEQIPPMFSAKKIDGKKLYKFARKGIEIEREPRKVTIKEIQITNIAVPEIAFRVVCTKGTYIRKLAEDIGEKIGCGAVLAGLRRTRSGDIGLTSAVTVDELSGMDRKTFDENILRV